MQRIGKLFFCALLLFNYCFGSFLDIAELGHEQYQDIIINNTLVKPANYNHKHCALRYKIIQQVLDQYKRPFTMLDVGASQGYYSFKTASLYDCVCVMIEGNNPYYPNVGTQLLDLCKANTKLTNIILLNKLIVPEDLQRLSECEHFDVVLAMNVIHWFGDRWQEVTDSLLNMGDAIIIETPPHESSLPPDHPVQKIHDYLKSKNAQIIGQAPRHTSPTLMTTFYLIQKNKNCLERKTWLFPKHKENSYVVTSTFEEKKLTKNIEFPEKQSVTSSWIPGINLLTFKMYNGTYPTKEMIKNSLKTLTDATHTDWMINNMILQGNTIKLIDYNDPTHKGPEYTLAAYNAHCEMIDLDDPVKIEHYFWHKLIWTPVSVTNQKYFFMNFLKTNDLAFEIGAVNKERIQSYSDLQVRVVYSGDSQSALPLAILPVESKNSLLEELITEHGLPKFCRINSTNASIYLKDLKHTIPFISFKFDIKSRSDLQEGVTYLAQSGYKHFNFSSREVPTFALQERVSSDTLLEQIDLFAQKDHDGTQLWGYIYAFYF